MKMIDVGESMKDSQPVEAGKDDKKKHYPILYLSTKQLPGLKGKEPGDKCMLHIQAEIKGYSLQSTKDDKGEGRYDIEIQRVGISDKKVEPEEEDDKEEKEKEETENLKKDAKERMQAGRGY